MYKKLDGYHAYYAYPNYENPFAHLNVLVQLASALYWKKYFGKIHLVCNLAHLETLQIYGVDKVYDSIDLKMLADMDSFESRYWSLSKIHLAGKLAEIKERFTILDTDLWLNKIPKLFNLSKDFIGLHRETFDVTDENCAYPGPYTFIGEEEAAKYDWSTLPINCGLMYFNNPDLVREWCAFAKLVIERNRLTPHPKSSLAVETIFIEQRVLPTLATHRGYNIGTIIPSTYYTTNVSASAHTSSNNTSSNVDSSNHQNSSGGKREDWIPSFSSSPLMQDCFDTVRHVWGLKLQFADPSVRKNLAGLVVRELERDGFNLSKYKMLISDNIVNL